MTCEADLHGSVTRMPSSILSDMGSPWSEANINKFLDCIAEDHTHTKAADDLRKHSQMDLLLALIGLSVVFGVAGWVTYLQNEKGAPAGGGAGAETEDDEARRRALRREKVM